MQGFISDSVNPFWRRLFFVAASLTAVLGAFYAQSLNYGFYHNFIEVLGIVASGAIFAITWHARQVIKNNFFLLLGTAMAFVGFFNLLHSLYYPGILSPGLLPSNESYLLSLAADYLLAIAFIVAPLVLDRRLNVSFLLVGLLIVTTIMLLSIFEWSIFPSAIDAGHKFTEFKNISEFTIATLAVVGGATLYRHRRYFERETIGFLYLSLAVGFVSSAMMGFFNNPIGYGNFVGHILKIFAFYFVYHTVATMSLRKPYRALFHDLETRDRELREERDWTKKLFDFANVFFVYIDNTQRVQRINRKGLEILGRREEEVVGKNWFDNFLPNTIRPQLKVLYDNLMAGKLEAFEFYENCVMTKNGDLRDIYWRNTLIKGEEGEVLGMLIAGEDVTDLKNHKRKMELIKREVQSIDKKH